MSSNILRESFDTSNIRHDKQFVVSNGREALAKWVGEQMAARNWSTYDVVRESGGYITSNSTVWNIQNGQGKEVRDKTLKGLAHAFKVPEDFVSDLYRGKPAKQGFEESDFARLYFKHRKLTKARQKEFERIWQMVERDYDRALLEDENKGKGDE